jgi:hypothetical protein
MPILERHGLNLNLNMLKDHRHSLLPRPPHKSKVSLHHHARARHFSRRIAALA